MTKKNHIYLSLLVIFLLFIPNLQAQEKSDVDTYKIAYITQQLDLSSAQAEKFWPIYNKHNKKYQDLKKNTWEPIKKDLKNIDKLTDNEAEQLLKKYRQYRRTRLANREDYINELLSVISPKKVMQLKKAEYDFNKELLTQIKSD
jgi:hypothetical protein